MILKELEGAHLLTGVDRESEQFRAYDDGPLEDSDVLRFELDGTVYAAIENPDDGYRSSMRDLVVGGVIKNKFQPVRVVCVHVDSDGGYDKHDLLRIYDIATAGLIVEVGTRAIDDYYPCFVANFNPDAMCINKAEELTDGND